MTESRLAGLALRAANKRGAAQWRLRRAVAGLRARVGGPNRSAAAAGFDLRVWNPIRWPRAARGAAAALGPLELLPAGTGARDVVRACDPFRARRRPRIEDVAAFHTGAAARARVLARLAATGAVTHLADGRGALREALGGELHDIMAAEARGLDAGERELRSIAARRAALRTHSSWACAWRAGGGGELPLVSILLAASRPQYLERILAQAARQTYPRLELVLAPNRAPFADAERRAAALPFPARVARTPAGAPLGAVLNAAAAAARGTLLVKMDDDDLYGPEHIWDLALARAYSGASLVGKGMEFVYLAGPRLTVHRDAGGGEEYRAGTVVGGALLISRRDLARAGGWRDAARGVDRALVADVIASGGLAYRTHGAGYVAVRRARGHTWEVDDDYFLSSADRVFRGWSPAPAGLDAPRAAPGGLADLPDAGG